MPLYPQSLSLASFSLETIKLAADGEKKRHGYGAAVAAALPFSAGKALVEIPKGVMDEGIENKIRTGRTGRLRDLVKNRATSRALGKGLVGAGTAPVFLSGIRDLKSGKKEDRNRGMAKLLASGALYSTGTGGLEAARDAVIKKLPRAKVLGNIKGIVGTRSILGTAAAAVTGASVAKSLEKGPKSPGKEPKKSPLRRHALPMAVGGAANLVRGGLEEVATEGAKATRRGIASKGFGRAGAGAVGAVALTELARRALAPKVKKAAEERRPYLGPSPTQLYGMTGARARSMSTDELKSTYQSILQGGAAERSPANRAVSYAYGDELQARGVRIPDYRMRHKARGPDSVVGFGPLDTAGMAVLLASPAAVQVAMSRVPPTARDSVLQEALDRMAAAEGVDVQTNPGRNLLGLPDIRYIEGEDGSRVIQRAKRSLPEYTAHELGHATAGRVRRGTIGNQALRAVGAAAALPAVILPLLAIEGTGDKGFTTPEELRNRAKFLEGFGLLAGAAQAPRVAEEALASAKGLGYMRLAGASGRTLRRSASTFAAALAPYAAPVAAPFLVARMLRGKAQKAEQRSGR